MDPIDPIDSFGDKLSIKLKVPHGQDFIIQSPDKKTFYLCFWYPENDPNAPITMFDYKECSTINKVEIIAGVTKTGGINDDQDNFGTINEVIFSSVGTYKIIVSPT